MTVKYICMPGTCGHTANTAKVVIRNKNFGVRWPGFKSWLYLFPPVAHREVTQLRVRGTHFSSIFPARLQENKMNRSLAAIPGQQCLPGL